MDKERLIKSLKRSLYEICGNEKVKFQNLDNLLKDYDEVIFDDHDFYNQLMRQFIDRRTSNHLDPDELSRSSIEIQKLRCKNKKKMDTKEIKRRTIRFEGHKSLVNLMALIYRCTLSEDARSF